MLCIPINAYSEADFRELFDYDDNDVNANLKAALQSISSSFNEEGVPVTKELLAAIMANLVKEVESKKFLPREEDGDYGMGPKSTYTVGGSRRSTPYTGGVDYKGRGYIQLTHKYNYEKYCPECVGTSTPDLDICGCKNQGECTVTDASICPQVKALQPERAAEIFASYYIDPPLGSMSLVELSNKEMYWRVANAIQPGNEKYKSEFEKYANDYLNLFSTYSDKTNSLLTWLNSNTLDTGSVIAQDDTLSNEETSDSESSGGLTPEQVNEPNHYESTLPCPITIPGTDIPNIWGYSWIYEFPDLSSEQYKKDVEEYLSTHGPGDYPGIGPLA